MGKTSVWRVLLLLGCPLALWAACLWGNPFPQVVAEQSLSLQSLSPQQKTNLSVAMRHLDGLVLQPGQTFSFNRSVGPRTVKRGYLPAASYLGGDSPATIGGGICLLSSTLYQLALATNLKVIQRVPHLRTIHSVPPGLDATVWYGGADLRFRNNLRIPLRLTLSRHSNTLTARWQGKTQGATLPIRRVVSRRSVRELLVMVFQNQRMISRDLYRLVP